MTAAVLTACAAAPPRPDEALVEDVAMTAELPAPDGLPALDMVGPMAGFPEHRRFALVALDEAGLLYALRSLDDPGLRFLVAPPAPFFPDYEPVLDDAWAERLGLTSAEDALVLLVVTTGATPGDATANLLAPVVVNQRTRRGAQVVLDQDLPLHAPLAG